MYVYVDVNVCTHVWRLEEGVGSLGVGVPSIDALPDVGALD